MKRFIMKSTIRWRLIVLFVAQIIIVLAVIGLYLNWHLRNVLETELGNKLELAAASIASQFDAELLLSLNPGDENTRTYRSFQSRLRNNRDATGVQRVYIAGRQLQNFVDTEPNIPIGKKHLRMEIDQSELENVWQGNPASSLLFEGSDNRLYKSGYAPLFLNEDIVAVIAVEGSAHSLNAVAQLSNYLLRLGAAGVILAIFLALVFSSRLIRPLNRLRESAVTIGSGNYNVPVQVKGHDEIAFLAKTMEEMRQGVVKRDTQLKAMLAGVAHEIRNPLGGIELFAGLLSDELRTTDQQERAKKILLEVQNLKSIVNDFLNYARPASPKRELCILENVLTEIQTLIKQDLVQQKTELICSTNGFAILIDPKHAQQIFINLAKNSLQAIKEGGKIEVMASSQKSHIEILFQDTGTGIALNDQEHLFEPFFTTRESGTGLGLAIVKTLCEANNGSIELYKSSKNGTGFKLLFEKAGEEKIP